VIVSVPDTDFATAGRPIDAVPKQFPTIALSPASVVTHAVVPHSMFAVIVIPDASKKPPPAVPPVAAVVMVVQVKLTLIVIDDLLFATSTSVGSRAANVSHEPEPLAALFHRLTESILTDEF